MSFCHLNFCLYLVWLRSFLCAILVNGFIQRFAAWRSGGFSAPNLLKIPELCFSTFVSKKAQNPPFCQTAVTCCVIFLALRFCDIPYILLFRQLANEV